MFQISKTMSIRVSGHVKGGLKAQLLPSAQGNALGLWLCIEVSP